MSIVTSENEQIQGNLEHERTANPVNEISSITSSVGNSWAQPVYNAAGNMTTTPWPNAPTTTLNWSNMEADDWGSFTADEWSGLPATGPTDNCLTATYDAWNRLVKLVDAASSHTLTE